MPCAKKGSYMKFVARTCDKCRPDAIERSLVQNGRDHKSDGDNKSQERRAHQCGGIFVVLITRRVTTAGITPFNIIRVIRTDTGGVGSVADILLVEFHIKVGCRECDVTLREPGLGTELNDAKVGIFG